MKIVPQKQPTDTSCTNTCLGMLTGIPVLEIEAEEQNYEPIDFLRRNGIKSKLRGDVNFSINPNKIYLLGVPSLNYIGCMHNIIYDTRDFTIYDPNNGVAGKKYYTTDDPIVGDLMHHLKAWRCDLEIIL